MGGIRKMRGSVKDEGMKTLCSIWAGASTYFPENFSTPRSK